MCQRARTRDYLSSAAPTSAACFRRKASSFAFASAVWVSTSHRAAARSCFSCADRSRSCFSAALRRPLYPEGFVACFRRQCRLSLGAMPRCRKILPQLRGQLALVMCGLTRMENPTTPFGLGCWVLFPLSKYPQEAPAGALGAAEHYRWALWTLEADLGIQHLAHGFT